MEVLGLVVPSLIHNSRDVQLFSDPRFLGTNIKILGFILWETGDLGT